MKHSSNQKPSSQDAKSAQANLSQNELDFHWIFSAIENDERGLILNHVNPSLLEELGIEYAELQHFDLQAHPLFGFLFTLSEGERESLQKGKSIRLETALADKPIVRITLSHLHNGQGSQLVGSIEGINKLKENLDSVERMLTNAQNVANLAFWEFDIRTGKRFWSEAMYEQLRWPATKPPPGWDEYQLLFHPHDRALIAAAGEKMRTGQIPDIEEFRSNPEMGEIRYFKPSYEIERDEDGNILRFSGSLLNITEKKATIKAIQRNAANFQKIFKKSPIAIMLIQPFTSEVEEVNPAFEDLFEVKRDEVVYRSVYSFLDLEDQKQEFRELLSGRRKFKGEEMVFQTSNDETIHCLVASEMMPEANLCMLMLTNITRRIKILKEIRQKNEQLKAAQKLAKLGYWDWNWEENITSWSEEMHVICDSPDNNILHQQDFLNRIHPEDIEGLYKTFDKSVKSREAVSVEFRFKSRKNETRHLSARAKPLINDEGRVYRMEGTLQDITERKRYQFILEALNTKLQRRAEELSRSNKELEQFAYIASHDLQEPLRMVSSFLSQLEKKYGDSLDDRAKQYIHFATDGAARMRTILLDLLAYSRADKSGQEREEVDLNLLLTEIQEQLNLTISERSAVIKVEDLPTLNIEKGPLRQVFQNLLSNALKYCPPSRVPEIEISYVEREGEMIFSVSDNGIGIEPEFHEKIFVIFQRLHTQQEYSGTGIGLAICKKIIDSYHGRIWVESSDEGSAFYFSLNTSFNVPTKAQSI